MPAEDDLLLPQAEPVAGGDADLLGDEVDAGEHLGDRVLDLDPAVDLDEVEAPLRVEQELERPGALVAGGHHAADGEVAQPLASGVVHRRRRPLLDDLLVAALHRAVALPEVHAVAVAVDDDLHLDVPRLLDPLLEVDRVVAEGGLRLRPRERQRLLHLARRAHEPHPASAAARRRLEQHRVAGLGGLVQRVVQVGDDPGAARHGGQAVGRQHASHRVLRREALEDLRARPDEGEVVRDARLRERRVLGQEAVAGVHGVAAGDHRRADDGRLVQVALARLGRADADRLVGHADRQRVAVGLAVGDDGRQAEVAAGAEHAHGDLAAVGDEDLRDHG